MSRPTTATIHSDALRHNLARVRALAPGSKVMAVVKADGYGHGLERVARALEGADAFGVAALSDAERLRSAGMSQRIVLLSGFDEPADLAQLRRLDVDTVVHHDSQLAMLEAERDAGNGARLRCWLKLDTGMHRLGFPPARATEVRARLQALPSVATEIVLMSHFASSDEFDGEQTRMQLRAFDNSGAVKDASASLSNSAAVLGWPDAHRDWVRAGGALYGLSVVAGRAGEAFGLRPAMTLSTRLIAINRVLRGERVGYSATWECPEDMDVGVAAIGYGDGYPRAAPPGTPVLLNGRRVPIIGRVSMDLMTLDLRGLPEARVGDPVVLWGEGLPAEEVAAAAGTISYELTCSITRRVRFVDA
ncbi:alanine racemase [soil metagenome]